jgi:hypothetical protein
MNYKSISHKIRHLVEQMNKWLSTITIPQGDEYLDISSAAMGKLSTTPIGASNNLSHFPKESLLLCTDLTPNYSMKIHGQCLRICLRKWDVLVDVD